VYGNFRPFYDVPFQERLQSKIDGEVKVTVAVLSAEESRQLFGVNLAGKDIQPVWIRVQNADRVAYWLMSAGLDPDYFSPLEAAYVFHGTIGSSVNKKIDDHFTVMNFRNPIAPGASVSGFIFSDDSSDGTAKVVYESKDGRTQKTFDALDWLALLTTHIPNKNEQMVRYYGYYSNKSRG
jgi:hypothetical protein